LALSAAHWLGHRHGIVSSGLIHFGWLLLFLCSLLDIIWVILLTDPFGFIPAIGFSLAFFAQFLLFFFADPRAENKKANASPETDSSFFSRLTFFWFNEILVKNCPPKGPLTFEDLYELDEPNRAQQIVPKWEEKWQPKAESNSQN
jgi:hypothetical protein